MKLQPEQASCQICGHSFDFYPITYQTLGIHTIPKTCPRCKDQKTQQTQIILKRECVFYAVVNLGDSVIPILQKAEEYRQNNNLRKVWGLAIKGSWFGSDWRGRIQLYSYLDPNQIIAGQRVFLRDMVATKRIWTVPQTQEKGPGYIRVPQGTPGAEERIETDPYVVIEPADAGTTVGTLVWTAAFSCHGKYDHKATLLGSPLWKKQIEASVRSGYASTVAWLAIQEKTNPIILKVTEEKNVSKEYTIH